MPKLRSVADAAQRFTSCVLNDNGRAFYVTKAVTEERVEGFYLDDDEQKRTRLNLTSELCQPFHVGYVFYRGHAIYTERVPVRRVLQGAHVTNMRTSKVSPNSVLYTKDFATALANKYPTVQEAVDGLRRSTHRSVPVSREFALVGSRCDVLYQETPVGSYDGKKFKLDPSFCYLKEQFEEVFNGHYN